jgi:hypothetical protein
MLNRIRHVIKCPCRLDPQFVREERERGYILVEALVVTMLIALAFGLVVLVAMPRHG